MKKIYYTPICSEVQVCTPGQVCVVQQSVQSTNTPFYEDEDGNPFFTPFVP